ncbi:hypothetical protein WMY93_031890 [Mugilogobius chulae]|uniref:Uncharacterized protein n=1 Tax=Mugilogobius chulae TaxID=88201 RepID=A0AAW0MCW9_9GOBI
MERETERRERKRGRMKEEREKVREADVPTLKHASSADSPERLQDPQCTGADPHSQTCHLGPAGVLIQIPHGVSGLGREIPSRSGLDRAAELYANKLQAKLQVAGVSAAKPELRGAEEVFGSGH